MNRRIAAYLVIFVATLLVAGLVTLPLFVRRSHNEVCVSSSGPAIAPLQAAPALLQAVAGSENSIADVAARVTPSVVNIFSSKQLGRQKMPVDPFFDFFFGPHRGMGIEPPKRKQQSLGSGVIVSPDGYILTNNHVVENATEILVSLTDAHEYKAKVVGTDPPSDLALLKIPATNLKPITIGDSTRIRVGDVVLAIGNPLGVGQTVTMGIISAVGRANTGIVDYEDFIQTDAAINPGNSGGALVNMQGELIGVNTAIASMTGGYQGIGFAIPSAMAIAVKESLVKHGRVIRGWLGVSIQNVSQDLADGLGLAPGKGVLVADVTRDGPADRAGVQREDLILAVDGVETNDMGRLRTMIAVKGKDTRVTLKVKRKEQLLEIPVVLGDLPADLGGQATLQSKDAGPLSGLSLRAVNRELAEKYELPRELSGLVVVGLAPDSAAVYSGLREGDVILEANRRKVERIEELQAALGQPGRSLLLLIYRQGYTIFLTLRK